MVIILVTREFVPGPVSFVDILAALVALAVIVPATFLRIRQRKMLGLAHFPLRVYTYK